MEGTRIMPDPDIARDYQERDVRAVHEVLIELGQVLGSWREKFVIVGGAVPWLSFQKAIPPHIGTMDLDLDLDSTALCDGEYASLIEALQAKGYERGKAGMKPFQLRRWIKVDEGDPIGVLIDLLMPRQARGDHNKVKLIDGLRVQKTDGGEVALRHKEMRKFEGTMPDGRHNEVKLQIATIPALLSMKGYALFGRDKKKDAYDIYYSIYHFKGGVEGLAAECRPLLDDQEARTGFEYIAEKFRNREDFGPMTVRIFLEESTALGEMTADQVQTDAFMRVSALLEALGLIETRTRSL